jgi:murein DD-endopeptidase MepM/ murein hydrolase activator NlpD
MKKIIIVFVSILVLLTVCFIIYWFYSKREEPFKPVLPVVKYHYAYKIRIDSLRVQYGEVKNNQNLANILNGSVSNQMIDRISKNEGAVFDVRKIKTGQKYARIYSKDLENKLLYFIYEVNPIDFVVFDFRDSLKVYTGKKEVSKVLKVASGTIRSSLWNTFEEGHLDAGLAMKMADVYAWTIDFYGLQKGDNFKLVYEEIIVDSISTGTDRILASIFSSGAREFYAFYFDQKESRGYFDDAGQSLQRSFLKAPLRFSRISSRFSRARMHPILRIVRPHFGVDYSAPKGTPVVSLGNGRVYEAGWKGGYGRFIGIRHNSIYSTTYAHLSGYAKGIHPGSVVKQGDLIGYVGSSGLATGPHLDFRVYRNGNPVDPLKLESPPTEPVASAYMTQYKQLVTKMKAKLDSIR